MKNNDNQVSEYWGEFHTMERPKLSWLESRTIEKYIHIKINGVDKPFYQRLFEIGRKFKRAAIVGCGTGELERALYHEGLFESAVGYDISQKSIDVAKEKADDNCLPISYQILNCGIDKLGSMSEFDLVLVCMSAHHIENLDHLFSQCSRILSDDGYLVLNEYVGPDRFQQDENTLAIINKLLQSINLKLRYNHLVSDGSTRDVHVNTPIEHFLKHDPSEAINSSEIQRFLKKYFMVHYQCGYGGTLNHMLLTGIVENIPENEFGETILNLLMSFEDVLIQHNVVKNEFLFGIYRPRKTRFQKLVGIYRNYASK